jgi:hypothetical protein
MKLSRSARYLKRTGIGYRTEGAYGEGYRDAGAVLGHEAFELGNYYSLHEAEDMLGLQHPSTTEGKRKRVRAITRELEHRFGRRPSVLWLTTKTGVRFYGSRDPDHYDIPSSALVIQDLGPEGQLFAMSRKELERIGA